MGILLSLTGKELTYAQITHDAKRKKWEPISFSHKFMSQGSMICDKSSCLCAVLRATHYDDVQLNSVKLKFLN